MSLAAELLDAARDLRSAACRRPGLRIGLHADAALLTMSAHASMTPKARDALDAARAVAPEPPWTSDPAAGCPR